MRTLLVSCEIHHGYVAVHVRSDTVVLLSTISRRVGDRIFFVIIIVGKCGWSMECRLEEWTEKSQVASSYNITLYVPQTHLFILVLKILRED